ncbi:SIMPL domain-containing protein [Actinoplanes flavus]|uniref:SIMPL domain-containing protein n=1 Tax=Actinoplanes flavus TaxID=2820290 RepID=A0ABS3UJZ3_9ACTN|nr:SIMPL domain-containing protein [Actinoplanes flavus]MBO3739110.1 SIMPL domain-containing protein [Actinoplanes flavus]
MLISRVAAPVAALTTLFALTAGPAVAAPARDSVTVTGTGAVYGEPDILVADFAAEAAAPTVGEALERASAAATRMRDTLVGSGTAPADLQTSHADIGAQRDDKGKITGYTVTQGLTAKIRDPKKAGTLLTAAVTAGGDAARLNGVSWAIDDDTALLAEARRKAFADAEGKAELYAGAAGRKLGRVVRVSDVPFDGGEPGVPDRKFAADAAMPVEPGRQQLTATVTVEWILLP